MFYRLHTRLGLNASSLACFFKTSVQPVSLRVRTTSELTSVTDTFTGLSFFHFPTPVSENFPHCNTRVQIVY